MTPAATTCTCPASIYLSGREHSGICPVSLSRRLIAETERAIIAATSPGMSQGQPPGGAVTPR